MINEIEIKNDIKKEIKKRGRKPLNKKEIKPPTLIVIKEICYVKF